MSSAREDDGGIFEDRTNLGDQGKGLFHILDAIPRIYSQFHNVRSKLGNIGGLIQDSLFCFFNHRNAHKRTVVTLSTPFCSDGFAGVPII